MLAAAMKGIESIGVRPILLDPEPSALDQFANGQY